jgi:3-oxoacyl-[acyl-carrier protein] reductase
MSGLKRVIITGGSGGLGKSIQRHFLAVGWGVIALGRKDLDLGDQSAVEAFFSAQQCDLLICAAGMVKDQILAKMGESTWDELFEINYKAAERCALAAIAGMAKNGCGHIVFLSSHSAIHPPIGQVAYATSKAALLGLTRDLAVSVSSNRIRVNAILPGFLETPMTAEVSDVRRKEVLNAHVMGEFNSVDCVAEFIHFLHERMPFTSGQIFQLDSRP